MELSKIIKKNYRLMISLLRIPYYIYIIWHVRKLPTSENGYVVISPSLTLSGAPLLSKAIYDDINSRRGFDCLLLSIYDGELKKRKDWDAINLFGCRLNFINSIIIKTLINKGYENFICNSTISATLAKNINLSGGKAIAVIHEMANVIKNFGLESHIYNISHYSRTVLFSSSSTYNDFCGFLPYKKDFSHKFIKQGVYNLNIINNYENKTVIKEKLKKTYNIPADKKVILGIGNDLERKGFKYFKELSSLDKSNIYIWITNNKNINNHLSNNLLNLPIVNLESTFELFFISDVFFLSSTEDPFPSVILEAMLSGLPVISLIGSGGADEIIDSSNGIRIEKENLYKARDFIKELSPQKIKAFEVHNHKYIYDNYNLENYVKYILSLFEE